MECTRLFFFFFLLSLCCFQAINGLPMRRITLQEHYSSFQERAAARSARVLCEHNPMRSDGRVFYPTEYGADPTGQRDSTDAILKALHDAFNVQQGKELLPGINDLGGVIIDLQGGNYEISRPIRFPASGGGNVVMQGGTLRATKCFPKDKYLIELWSPSSKRPTISSSPLEDEASEAELNAAAATNKLKRNLGVYYEDITFRDILFDSSFTGGGLMVLDSVRTRVDNCFFIHFMTDGIFVRGGHETFISSSFLGQHLTIGGDPRERNFSGVAIDLASNDNAVTDVAIFSGAIGIVLRGQANMITGVHCYNKATYWGGIGILVKLAGLGQTRIDNCYMDFNSIVAEDPVQVHITNGFFLGNGNVVLKSVKGKISGLTIVNNMFAGSGWGTPIVKLDDRNGPFKNVEQVVVDQNNVLEMVMKSTVAKMAVARKGKSWVADFKSRLLFPNRITHLQYSLYVKGGTGKIPAHAVTAVRNNTVEIRAVEEVDGVVSVEVDQNSIPGEKIPLV